MAGARREPAQADSAKAGGKSLGSRCHPSRPNSCLHLLFLTRLLHRSSGPRLSLLCHSGCPPQWGLPTSLPPREEQRKEEKPCSFLHPSCSWSPAGIQRQGQKDGREVEGVALTWEARCPAGTSDSKVTDGSTAVSAAPAQRSHLRCLPLLCRAPGLKGSLSSSEFWVIHNNNCDYWLRVCLIKTENRRVN